MHLGERLLEIGDHFRQRIARLRVRGDHGELAFVALAVLLHQILDVVRVEQDALDDLQQLAARIGQAEQALAFAHEQLHAQFVFQILDVLGHAGLRSEQRIAHLGEVEVVTRRFADDPKLLKVHFALLTQTHGTGAGG